MLEKLLMNVGYYKPVKEYWIDFNQVHITEDFAAKKVGWKKMRHKLEYYGNTGEFESKVVLDRNFTLTDGYSTYRIIEKFGTGKIPVWFKD